ncbi:methyltransferase domain-containing protein [Acetobacteraceae bacterium H6797]|nr:methyltransferase domain-containing protein [Acetobacteraceae bacterium H6797]
MEDERGNLALVLAAMTGLAGLAPSDVVTRRLERARALIPSLDLSHPDEQDPAWAALLDAVTVQETRFFRAASQLLDFRELCLPTLFEGRGGQPVKILSAGCATGEEAWSLALLASEAAQANSAPAPSVIGIDLCRHALAKAKVGKYPAGPPDALREVPTSYRQYFLQQGGDVLLPAHLHAMTQFMRANLLRLPAGLGQLDAICCRNVLIYLTDSARHEVLRGLVQHLAPGGALLLGATDSPPPKLGLRPWAADTVAIWRKDAR